MTDSSDSRKNGTTQISIRSLLVDTTLMACSIGLLRLAPMRAFNAMMVLTGAFALVVIIGRLCSQRLAIKIGAMFGAVVIGPAIFLPAALATRGPNYPVVVIGLPLSIILGGLATGIFFFIIDWLQRIGESGGKT